MKKTLKLFLLFPFLLTAPYLFGGGAAESASTTSRGDYLAGQGMIIPSSEIFVDSYLSQIDYQYPDSRDSVTVHLYPGARLVPRTEQDFWLQVGLQGIRTEFEDLPPLYLLLVIDTSGSMSEANKLDWIKRSVSVLLSKLRTKDSLGVITFSDESAVLFGREKLTSMHGKETIRNAVTALTAYGESNPAGAVSLAYRTIEEAGQAEEIRRILFLSDGKGLDKQVIDSAARQFRRTNIPLTTVGYGESFNLVSMIELARACSGSSRFISDSEKMQEEFSSDLDRMVVTAAWNIDVEVQVPAALNIIETWGYENRISGNHISYHLPSVHLRDYETMLIHLKTAGEGSVSSAPYVSVTVRYDDLSGGEKRKTLREILADAPPAVPLLFPSHPDTARAVTMYGIARALQKIGRLDETAKEWTKSRPQPYLPYRTLPSLYDLKQYDTVIDALMSAEPDELTTAVRYLYQDAVDTTIEIRRRIELLNTVMGTDYFSAERQILEKYLTILKNPASLRNPDSTAWLQDTVLPEQLPSAAPLSVLSAMFGELLEWVETPAAVVAVSPAFVRAGSGKVPRERIKRFNAALETALSEYALPQTGRAALAADSPVSDGEVPGIDLDAELAAAGTSRRYVIRAYIVHLYGADHIVLRLLDTEKKKLTAFTAAAVSVPGETD